MKSKVVTLPSQVLGRPARFCLYLPPQPPRGLLYLLHGHGGRCTDWPGRTNIEALAAARGLAVVMPDLADGYCMDMARGLPWFSYITGELPGLAARLCGRSFDPAHTWAAGLSAGGYGALRWAMTAPRTMAACASLSGVTDLAARIALLPPARLDEFRPLCGDGLTVAPQNDLPALTRAAACRGVPVFLACGQQDEFFPMNREYASLLAACGFHCTWRMAPGGHNWDYWSRWLAPAVDWMLAAAPPPED